MAKETYDEKLTRLNKESNELSTKKNKAKASLVKVTANFAQAEPLQEKNEAKVATAQAVKDAIVNSDNKEIIIKPLLDQVASIKKSVLELRTQAESSLKAVGKAKESSSELQTQLAKLKEDNSTVSKDLVADAPEAETSIATAWDDVVEAYTKSMIAVEGVLGLEQSLTAIDQQLIKIDTPENLGEISAKFTEMYEDSKKDVKRLGETKKNEEESFKKAESNFNDNQDEIDKVKENQAVKDAINS